MFTNFHHDKECVKYDRHFRSGGWAFQPVNGLRLLASRPLCSGLESPKPLTDRRSILLFGGNGGAIFGRIATNERMLLQVNYLAADRTAFIRQPVDGSSGDLFRP